MLKFFKKKEKPSEEKSFKIGDKSKKRATLIVRAFSAICTATFLVVFILILESLLSMGILPTKYLLIVAISLTLLVIVGILMFFLAKKHRILAIVFGVIYIIISAIMCWGAGYLYQTRSFFSKTTAKDYYIETYSVYVLEDSSYEEITDLEGERDASYIDTIPSYNEAFEEIKKEISFETVVTDTYIDAAEALISGDADFVLLSESYLAILDDLEEGFAKKVRSVYDIEIKIYDTVEVTDVDVLNDSFNIYISGIDTKGTISTVSRSDVNMIVTVNPKTHTVLLTSIPRDYYVQLHGTVGIKDKLTHSGIYGPKMTINTVEDLLGIKLNYYVRVNFSSVINLVNAIGGVYLTPDITLSREQEDYGWCNYYAGVRTLFNGPCALRYARERKAYADGDLHRIQNQQQVMTAILDKLASAEIIKNYSSVLNAVQDNFETSIPEKKIYQLINNQLDSMPKWKIEDYHLEGTDSYSSIYSSSMEGTGDNGSNYYVMEPDYETVENAKAKIQAVFNGE